MKPLRLIARLDIKGQHVIKGIHLEGLRKVGDPQDLARRYYHQGIDELIFMDAVASLYGRNSLEHVVRYTAEHLFVPLTVGGGVRGLEDARRLLRAGADKIALNTAAVARPELITELASHLGNQCVVLSIEAKRVAPGKWEARTDGGREVTGLDVLDWAEHGTALGAGEILLTSIDREGTRNGFDLELTRAVAKHVDVPVIASGGLGRPDHLVEVFRDGLADAAAVADALHYERHDASTLRAAMRDAGLPVRTS